MAALKGKKIVGAGFPNAVEVVRVNYDFAKDTGAIGSYEVLEAENDCVIKLRHAAVKTAVTSSGALTMDLGKGAAGTEIISNKAVSALTLESLHEGAAQVKLAAGEKICMNLEAFDATAGKVEFVFEITKY